MVQTTCHKMFRLKGFLLFSYLVALVIGAAVKPPSAPAWTSFVPKSVFSRALGPPISGIDTISVPYVPKSPLFPKFVDPKMMISKKTDLLTNLFGGLGPAAYPMGFNPFLMSDINGSPSYGTGIGKDVLSANDLESSLESSGKLKSADEKTLYKRGMFGPFSSKFGTGGPMFGGPGPKFGPGGPMFGSAGPKFGMMSQFSGPDSVPDYVANDAFSRKKRSMESSVKNLRAIMDDNSETKDLGPPPAYPTLTPISEEPDMEASQLLNAINGATAPKQYLPGMFSPFGPVVDPSMFIAKKSAFLDTLFKNLATSTESPTTTEVPVPKSTIVPPSFWIPTSVIPSPTEYTDKVSAFLDKLFDSLKINQTASTLSDSQTTSSDPSVDVTQARIARSMEDLSSINAAKDSIVDSVLSELSDLKGDMMTTMNDLIAYQKTAAASMLPKKPFKPFAPGIWPTKPTVDAMLPFQQRMEILSQVFDMLTDLQKNITLAINEAIEAKASSTENPAAPNNANVPVLSNNVLSTGNNVPVNLTLLDAIKNKLSTLDIAPPNSYTAQPAMFGFNKVRMVPKTPASFWVSYPEDTASAVKRGIEDGEEDNYNQHDGRQHARALKMQMHQGYQSLPAGSIESVQAGGGSMPGHQGGGIKLLDTNNYGEVDKWADWMEYLRNEHQGHRHNHNHH